jgi:hypothetical protein
VTKKKEKEKEKEKRQTTKHKKKDPKPNPKISPVPPKYPTLFRSDWYQGQAIAPRWYIGL